MEGVHRASANQDIVIVDAPELPSNVLFLSSGAVPEKLSMVPHMTGRGFAGLMVLDVLIPQAQSLKEKRQPLRSIKTRLRNSGFSVSEVDHHDKWQRSQIAVSIVALRSSQVEDLLDDALRIFEMRIELDVTVRQRTVLAIDEYD